VSQELGAWLRQEREIRGWDRIEMAKRLIAAGQSRGDKHMPGVNGMSHNVYRWERGVDGVSTRHMLNYCAVLGIAPAQFPRDAGKPAAMADGRRDIPVAMEPRQAPTDPERSYPRGQAGQADLTDDLAQDSGIGDLVTAVREVLVAAHEGSERAEQAEQRGVGDSTVEQFRADVTRLSHEYMTGEPLLLFREMRRVRGRMYAVVDRRIWPRDAAEIYFLLGCMNGLMAGVADDLGSPSAAQELYRAGWAYATAIGQRPLLARLRLGLASLAYWNGQFRRAADLAASGLEHLSGGPAGVQLHLSHGRALARMGDTAAALGAVAEARDIDDQAYSDELTDIGGEYDLSRATRHYLIASVLAEVPAAAADASAELERAVELYASGPGPGETHGYATEAIARVSLAEARLRAAQLDGIPDALAPVLALSRGKRIGLIQRRLDGFKLQLDRHPDRASARLHDLADRIEDYGHDGISGSAELSTLPA
jgi:transcriptional regulator with XRE-family HTH domain